MLVRSKQHMPSIQINKSYKGSFHGILAQKKKGCLGSRVMREGCYEGNWVQAFSKARLASAHSVKGPAEGQFRVRQELEYEVRAALHLPSAGQLYPSCHILESKLEKGAPQSIREKKKTVKGFFVCPLFLF